MGVAALESPIPIASHENMVANGCLGYPGHLEGGLQSLFGRLVGHRGFTGSGGIVKDALNLNVAASLFAVGKHCVRCLCLFGDLLDRCKLLCEAQQQTKCGGSL